MKLLVAGHNVKKGYAIIRIWSDDECRAAAKNGSESDADIAPIRFIQKRKTAFVLVDRWNKRFATH